MTKLGPHTEVWLRMPNDLRAKLEALKKKEHRSTFSDMLRHALWEYAEKHAPEEEK